MHKKYINSKEKQGIVKFKNDGNITFAKKKLNSDVDFNPWE